jgi:hypothetical protein
MVLPVIPALFKEMAAQRQKSGRPQGDVAKALKRHPRTIERWENLENLPMRANEDDPGGDLARAVAGYAEVLDTDPISLWTDALQRAKRERKNYEASLKAVEPGPSLRSRRAAAAPRPRSEK